MVGALSFLGGCLWFAAFIIAAPMGVRGRNRHPIEIPATWVCFALGAVLFALSIGLSS